MSKWNDSRAWMGVALFFLLAGWGGGLRGQEMGGDEGDEEMSGYTDEVFVMEGVRDPEEGYVSLRTRIEEATEARFGARYDEAIILARQGYAEAEARGEETLRAEFLFLIARTHWSLGDFAGATENYLRLVGVARDLEDTKLLARAHAGLGVTYTGARQFEAAQTHFEAAMEAARVEEDRRLMADVLNGYGNKYLAERNYPKAREIHERALGLRQEIGDTVGFADSLTNIGTVALANRDTTTALANYRRALEIYLEKADVRRIASGHRRYAAALRRSGQVNEAIVQLRTALELAENIPSRFTLGEIYRELARAHESRGELRSALLYQRRYAVTREAQLDDQTRQRIAELNARYESERRENEINVLRLDQENAAAELKRRRLQNSLLGGFLFVGLVFAAGLTLLQRARLRAERAARLANERAREEAERAARLKSRLLQIAAHDLKAPLAALSASARRIEEQPKDTVAVTDHARHIRTDAARMAGLVREFLDSAAIEAGHIQLHRVATNLKPLAAEAVEDFQALAMGKEQTIEFLAVDPEPPLAMADADRMRQIIDNLVANALKFTPSGGRVTVGIGTSGRWVYLEVSDSGPGLNPSDMAKMFQPFQPLTAVPTGKESSTGLGLFIARELVAMQDGMLEVESQPGKGAIFRVLLPCAPVDVEVPAVVEGGEEAGS